MAIINALESIRTPFLTVIMSIFSFFGEETFMIVFLSVIYWCVNKKLACKIVFSFTVAGGIIRLLKIALCVQRPWAGENAVNPVQLARKYANGFMFPSAHACNSTILAVTFLKKQKHGWIKIIAAAVFILTPFARIYLGTQTLLSVIIAMIVSLIISLIVDYLFENTVLDKEHYVLVAGALILIPVILLITALSQYYCGISEYKNLACAVKMSGAGIGMAVSWLVENSLIRFNEKTDELWKQLVKAAIGIAAMMIIKYGLGAIFSLVGEAFWPGDFMRYFLMTFAGMGIYPLFIKHYFSAAY